MTPSVVRVVGRRIPVQVMQVTEGGGEENNASTSMTNSTISTAASPATTLPTLPLLPLAARLHKLSCDTASEEPKAGPSNSAAQFDLEVGSKKILN